MLYGGTALALQLGHRESVDFDFFSAQPLDPFRLHQSLDFLAKGRIIQQERNTLTALASTEDGPVRISFFGGLSLRCVDYPIKVPPGVPVAGPRDIFGCKCAVVQQRENLKDLQDICALLRHGLSLAEGLDCGAAIYGRTFNPRLTLAVLSYPRALAGLPANDRRLLTEAVKAVRSVPAMVEPLGRIGEARVDDASGQATAGPS